MQERGRAIGITCGLLLLAVIACGAAVALLAGPQLVDTARDVWGRWQLAGRQDDLDAVRSSDTTPVLFTIESGETPYTVALKLAAIELIDDPELLFDYVRYEGFDRQIGAGTYALHRALSIRQIVARLIDPAARTVAVNMLDGWRLEELIASLDASPRLAFSGQDFAVLVQAGAPVDPGFAALVGLPEGASLEGFLLPGTYQVPPDAGPRYLLDAMLNAFASFALNDGLAAAAAGDGLTLYQVATLASIVRREAVRDDEMPLIAGVYLNRLAINMKLDADPTVQYGLGDSRGSWWPRITQADYTGVQSPYNTYLVTGYPPGPIASAGRAALLAVVNLEPSTYYFFRADCRSDGYHDFAETYEEHLANGC